MTLRQANTASAACHDVELRQREQRRENGRDERADERDVVEREGDDAPFGRELQPGERGEAPRPAAPVARLISVRISM